MAISVYNSLKDSISKSSANISFDVGNDDNRAIIVMFRSSSRSITITYNETNLTQIVQHSHTSGQYCNLYVLKNPTSGTNTLSISVSSGYLYNCVVLGVSGVYTSGTNAQVIDKSKSETWVAATGTTKSLTLTTNYDNSLLIDYLLAVDYATTSSTPASGQTVIQQNNGQYDTYCCSKKTSTSKGDYSMGDVLNTQLGSNNGCQIVFAIREYVAPTFIPQIIMM